MHVDPAEAAIETIRTRAGLSRRLLLLAEHLPREDRALLEAIYDRGMRPTDFARAVRLKPRTIRNRVQRIVQRIGTPVFQYVAGRSETWSEDRRAIAELVVLHGISQREAARRLGVSQHRIRQEVARLRAQCEAGGGE